MSDAATYYVSVADGNDTNCTGTSTTAYVSGSGQPCPFKTITKANSLTKSAGDSILFKRGDIFSGTTLLITTSGTSGNHISYGAYGAGLNPQITVSGGARGMDIEASYLDINGIDVTSTGGNAYWFWGSLTDDAITNTVIGSASNEAFYFYNGTYTNFLIGNATSTASSKGVDLQGSSNTFTNLTISNSSFTNSGTGFSTSANLNSSQIINSVFNGNSLNGVLIAGSVNGLTISNSQMENNTGVSNGGLSFPTPVTNTINNVILSNDMITGNSGYGILTQNNITNLTIASTSVSNNGASGYLHGMYVSGGSINNLVVASSTFSGNTGAGLDIMGSTTATITNSTFNSNGYNGVTPSSGVVADGTSIVTITNSSASNNGDDGMDAGTSANLTINNCSSTNNGYPGLGSGAGNGYSWHLSSTGTIKNSYAGNNLINAIAHVGSASVSMYNNVFYSNISEVLPLIWLQGTNYVFQNNTLITGPNYSIPGSYPPQLVKILSGTTVNMANNILYAATTTGTDVGILNSGTLTEDYDLLYGINGMTYSGITPGAHNLATNPLFTNYAGADYSLSSASPAINSGAIIAGRTTDKLGNPIQGVPDIGAYEYQDTTAPTVALNIPTNGATVSGTSVTLSASSTDDIGVAGVRFIVDGTTQIGNEVTATSSIHTYSTTWNTASTTDGSHTLIAVARDTSGNYATSTGITVIVQNTPTPQPQTTTTTSGGGGTSPAIFGLVSNGYGQFASPFASSTPTVAASSSSAVRTSAAPQLGSASGYRFARNLSLHMRGEDVRQLQKYLNSHGFVVSSSEAGSLGSETMLFGMATYRALVRFQEAHADTILTPNGSIVGTGYFGPSTRAYVNEH